MNEEVKKVGDLEPSQRKEKSSTKSTVKLTREQALEILQQSLIECKKAGLSIRVMPTLYSGGQQYIAIMMASVTETDGNLVLLDGTGDDE